MPHIYPGTLAMTLRLRHLSSQDYKEMPWKNGGGSTTELAIFPPGSSMDDPFLWRISLAQLNGSGPFSTFPGYDRSIVQLSGKPMNLIHAGHPLKKLASLEPYPFPGEWTTEGQLEGKAEDFNLMLRRDSLKGSLRCFRLEDRLLTLVPAQTSVLWVLRGEVVWEGAGQSQILKARDTLIVEGSSSSPFQIKGANSVVFFAAIDPKVLS